LLSVYHPAVSICPKRYGIPREFVADYRTEFDKGRLLDGSEPEVLAPPQKTGNLFRSYVSTEHRRHRLGLITGPKLP
jgi:hypothetical protein